jgi:hypothetical protein
MNILEKNPRELEAFLQKSMEELRERLRRLEKALQVSPEILKLRITI